MNRKILFLICFFFLYSYGCFSQQNYVKEKNQYDLNGQKTGYWIEEHPYGRSELYYINGICSGIFKSYTKQGKFRVFGEYTNDERTGIWYYFGDIGHLIMIQKDFSPNHETIITDSGKEIKYPYRCYAISFHPNGNKKDEGVLLWDSSPELDDVCEFGEWKFYNESGDLVKTVLH